MTIMTELVVIDPKDIAQSLADVRKTLDGAETDVVLDFCEVQRIDPKGLGAMEDLIATAEAKSVRIALRGLNVNVYKVLKLARLAGRFRILN
jgi:anti-anti-sigma regulatory factor